MVTSGEIIPAQPSDAAVLSAIVWVAKAHWGYPESWMEFWREQLTISPEFIEANDVFLARREGQTVAFCAVRYPEEGPPRLEHLWVLPERMRQGIGRSLFEHAAERARARGASRLTIAADPNAEPFYRHLGALLIGSVSSDIDGQKRQLPLLAFPLR